jgi:YedE family putative selenium metabolism protein
MKKNLPVILTGALIGLMALILTALGNPGNMGFCTACFLRDIAGALGLQSTGTVQAIRPEIIGIVLGAFLISLYKKEFRPRGGSAPFTRFLLGMVVMTGALMFLGCPLRMLLRIGGGDLNAVVGLAGFIAGVGLGAVVLNKGFSLRRSYPQGAVEGWAFPIAMALLLLAAMIFPALFHASTEGPGSLRAPLIAALAAGLIVGAMAQRSRFCTMGGFRDALLFRDFHLLWGAVALVATVLLGNLILGKFHLGFSDQPIAHTDGLWNFMGMALAGWGSVLLGGCPLRQLILSGEGNSDSAVTVAGLITGAAICHNFGLASSAKGPTATGQIAVALGFVILAIVTYFNLQKEAK